MRCGNVTCGGRHLDAIECSGQRRKCDAEKKCNERKN
jgi:hypothetical protein